METNSKTVATRQFPGRLYAWMGSVAAVSGPVLYMLQLRAKLLTVPWYAPVLATVGLALIVFALVQMRSVWRLVGLAFCGLLAAGQWFVLISLIRLPAYTGPVTVGHRLPEFSATLADGVQFDQSDLAGELNSAMVFFRGRW